MKARNSLAGLIAVAVLCAVPGGAAAQEAEEIPLADHPRSGFWAHIGGGYGTLGCDDCVDREAGPGVSLAAGGTLNEKVLLGASIDGWSKEEGGTRVTASTLLATIRYYPSATGGFFLRGGLGAGVLEAEVAGNTGSENGAAALLGLGYDLRLSRSLSITPYLSGVGIALNEGDDTVNFGHLGALLTIH